MNDLGTPGGKLFGCFIVVYRGDRMSYRRIILLFLLLPVLAACVSDRNEDVLLMEDEQWPEQLTIELVGLYNHDLQKEKIMKFAEQHPNLEVQVRRYYTYSPSVWLMGGQEKGDPPDILELTPIQMKLFFHHGKIEALSLREPAYQDFLIHSPEGDVLGVKTKISPLIVYYNREIFHRHGLEVPMGNWDWAQFEQTVAVLKQKGENVYILASPQLLEYWHHNVYIRGIGK